MLSIFHLSFTTVERTYIGFHILFCWVPAHTGIKGIKAADKAAKQAYNPFNSPVPYSDIKLGAESFIRQKWEREWDAQTENKFKKIKPYIVIWPTLTPQKN